MRHRSQLIALIVTFTACAALWLVWFPRHATLLANWVGIGRGVDLILYFWVAISFNILLNLHLKLREQLELITKLTRQIALNEARHRNKLDNSSQAKTDILSS